MKRQHLAYYWVFGKSYDIDGCWDEETPENQFDFYDVFDIDGNCLNEGSPFYEWPTWDAVKSLVEGRETT